MIRLSEKRVHRDIAEIKASTRLEEVAARYVELRPRGNYLVGRCPFHKDGGRPNFVVYQDSQNYICFVCGAKGDVIDFVAQIEGVTKGEAIKELSGGADLAAPRRRAPVVDLEDRGDAVARDIAYQALLALLTLSSEHGDALVARGLSTRAIKANAYRTLPEEGREAVVDALLANGVDLAGVPGFAVSQKTGRWEVYGSKGLLIPVRGLRGRIAGMQIRADSGRSRYVWFSTPDSENRCGGGSSGAPCHVAGRSFVRKGVDIWITEGPLKADVASHFLGTVVLGVPGVTAWRKALPIVQALGAARVMLAFDQDADESTRAAVQRQVEALRAALAERGVGAKTVSWASGKGIDDALLSGERLVASKGG